MRDVEIRHGHLFCGLGGGARGFNRGKARVGEVRARFRCIGGIDVDAAAIRDFERLSGVPGTVRDLFSREQYEAFHGRPVPAGWREAGPEVIHAAFGFERPHIVFLSAPCKGFSGLLAEKQSRTAKYQALNGLTLRGVWLMLEAFKNDPVELIVFENVPRIATRGRHLLDQIIALLRAYGYVVAETTHDCGELGGLGQSRKRFLLVARHAEKVPPFLYVPEKKRLLGVGEVLDRMPLPGDLAAGPMHRVPSLQWRTWVRLAFVEAGADWRSLNRLKVEDGVLADFGIAPVGEWHRGVLGVQPWERPCGTITSRGGATNGRYAVADPRIDGHEKSVQMGVGYWDQPAAVIKGDVSVGTGRYAVADPRYAGEAWASGQYGVRAWVEPTGVVTGQRSPGQGGFSVADPRLATERPRFNNVYRVVRFDTPSPAVAGAGGPGNGLAVADPRAPERGSYKATKYRVTSLDEASGTVIAASTTGNGAYAVADPRTGFGPNSHRNKLKVIGYESTGSTVTGSDRVGSGALSVADPRPGFGPSTHHNIMQVHGWNGTSKTITSGTHPSGGALSVAAPRPAFAGDRREAYQTGGHYGVVAWDGTSGGVTAAGQHDNGRWSVADPREQPDPNSEALCQLPAPDDRLVCRIVSEDGTWHRPFTTLELAALQSLVDPEEQFELDGLSDSAWRERIGNAVPPAAAEAIAGVMGTTLLLAWSGQGFMLSSQPIWVRPIAVALATDAAQPLEAAE